MKKEIINQKFGANLKLHRKKARVSQQELAAKAGISTIYYGRVERGERCPTLDTLFKLSDALGMHPSELIDFDQPTHEISPLITKMKDSYRSMDSDKREKFVALIEEMCDLTAV